MAAQEIRDRVGNWTLANQLTFLRLVAVPFFILAVLNARFGVAFAIFLAASVTDVLDGLIARILRQRSRLGAYLDPAADKLLVTAAFVLLTQYPNLFQTIPMTVRIPIALTILTISRDVLIVSVALTLYLAQHKGSFEPSPWGKAATLCDLVLVGLVLQSNWTGRPILPVAPTVAVTLALTVISGFHYLYRTVRAIRRDEVGSGPGGRPEEP